MNLNFRKMTEEDLDQVMMIEHQNFPDPFPRKIFKPLINHSQYKCIVVYEDGQPDKVLGYALLYVNFGESHLQKLSIIEQNKLQSIGTHLMEYLLSLHDTENAEFNIMWLEFRKSNIPAKRLYDKLGFEFHCDRKEHYSHIDENGNEVFEDGVMMFKMCVE